MIQLLAVNKLRKIFLDRQVVIGGLILQAVVIIMTIISLQQDQQPDVTLATVAGKPGMCRVVSVVMFTDAWVNGVQPGMLVYGVNNLNDSRYQNTGSLINCHPTSQYIYIQVVDQNILLHLNTLPQAINIANQVRGCMLAIVFSLTGITIYLRVADRPVARSAYSLFYCASIIFFLININSVLWMHILLYVLGLLSWGMATTFVCLLPHPPRRRRLGKRIHISPYTPLAINVGLAIVSIPIVIMLPWTRIAISMLMNSYAMICVLIIMRVIFWGLRRMEANEKQMIRMVVVGIVFLLFVIGFNRNVVLYSSYSSFVLNGLPHITTIYNIPIILLPIVCGYSLIRHQFLGTTSLISRQVMRVLLWFLLSSFFVIPVVSILPALESALPGFGEGRYYLYAGLMSLSLWLFPLIWNKVRNVGDQVFYHDFYEYNRSLRELSSELTRLQHLDQICTFILPRLANLLHATGAALVVRTQGHGKGEVSMHDPTTSPWHVYLNDASFLSLDRLTSLANLAVTHHWQRSVEALLLDNVLLFALYDGDYLSGFLCIGSKLNFEPYSRQDKSFLETLAAQLSMLEVNSRYLEQAEADAQKLTALNRRVISVQEGERRHLALELHDEVLQQAMLLVRQLADASSMTDVAEAMPLARSLVTDLRQTCLELRPPLLDELGLEEALYWLANQTEQRAKRGEPKEHRVALKVNVFCIDTASIRLSADVELAFYRVVQEALSNILKHARANNVTIRLRYHPRTGMSLLVCDNGYGFMKGKTTHEMLGLAGMHERMRAVNGSLQLRTNPGRGVAIRALYKPSIISTSIKEQIEVIQ